MLSVLWYGFPESAYVHVLKLNKGETSHEERDDKIKKLIIHIDPIKKNRAKIWQSHKLHIEQENCLMWNAMEKQIKLRKYSGNLWLMPHEV